MDEIVLLPSELYELLTRYFDDGHIGLIGRNYVKDFLNYATDDKMKRVQEQKKNDSE